MKASIGQKVVIEVEKKYTDTAKLGESEIYVDPLFRRTENLTYCGIVKAIPNTIPCDEWNHKNKINPILKVGDKVYFKFVGNDNPIYVMDKDINDTSSKITLSIFYCWVICTVRDGEILPVGGWCLGEPVIEGGGEEVEMELESGKVGKVKVEYFPNTQIIKKVNEEKSKNKAKITHIGGFIGQKSALNVGDVVFSKTPNYITFMNTIEGNDYYCFYEDQVDAVLLEE